MVSLLNGCYREQIEASRIDRSDSGMLDLLAMDDLYGVISRASGSAAIPPYPVTPIYSMRSWAWSGERGLRVSSSCLTREKTRRNEVLLQAEAVTSLRRNGRLLAPVTPGAPSNPFLLGKPPLAYPRPRVDRWLVGVQPRASTAKHSPCQCLNSLLNGRNVADQQSLAW